MIRFMHRGNFNSLERFLIKATRKDYLNILEQYGRAGVTALSSGTPADSGKTAASWDFEIERGRNSTTIRWINTNINDGANIAVLLQYGHGTGTGGFVIGRDYINPAIAPIIDKIAEEAWKEVTS